MNKSISLNTRTLYMEIHFYATYKLGILFVIQKAKIYVNKIL